MNTGYVVNFIDLGYPLQLDRITSPKPQLHEPENSTAATEKRFEFPKSRNIRSLLSRGHLHACSWLVFGACSFLVGIGRKFDHQAAWVFPKILSPKATIFQASKLWNQTYSYLMLSPFCVIAEFFTEKTHKLSMKHHDLLKNFEKPLQARPPAL